MCFRFSQTLLTFSSSIHFSCWTSASRWNSSPTSSSDNSAGRWDWGLPPPDWQTHTEASVSVKALLPCFIALQSSNPEAQPRGNSSHYWTRHREEYHRAALSLTVYLYSKVQKLCLMYCTCVERQDWNNNTFITTLLSWVKHTDQNHQETDTIMFGNRLVAVTVFSVFNQTQKLIWGRKLVWINTVESSKIKSLFFMHLKELKWNQNTFYNLSSCTRLAAT